MNDFEFIQDSEEDGQTLTNILTGWETIVFQIEDEPPEG